MEVVEVMTKRMDKLLNAYAEAEAELRKCRIDCQNELDGIGHVYAAIKTDWDYLCGGKRGGVLGFMPEHHVTILEMHKGGASQMDIAEAVAITQSAVAKTLVKYGKLPKQRK